MEKKPSITTIIPYYNSEKTIQRALDSIYSQTILVSEIIIVDDASDFCSLEYLNNLVKNRYKLDIIPIKIISLEKNSGPAKARNIAWNSAKGDFIAFLDADDSWQKQKIEIQLKYFLDDKELILCGHKMVVINSSTNDNIFNENKNYQIINKNKILFSNRFQTPTVMLRSNIINRFPEKQKYSEDYYLWMDIILEKNKAIYINESLAFSYKQFYGDSGLSSNLLMMEKNELLNYLNFFKRRKISAIELIIFSIISTLKFCLRIIRVYLRAK